MFHSCSQRKMIIWSLYLILSLSNSILVLSSHVKHLCRPDQNDALWKFKREFNVHSNGIAADKKTEKWKNNTDCSSWDGVSCNPKTGQVVELLLGNSSLNGPLKSNSSLFRLQHLQSLDLSANNLSGILPDSIGNLKYLRVLSLGDCNFFGKIPSSLGNLSDITNFDLSTNGFTGEIPDSMGNLNKLSELHLGSNKLSGNFPSVLLNLSELTLIDLGSNQFEENNFNGPIPRSISKLVGIFYLDLSLWNTGRGVVDFSIFLHLMSLNYLDLSYLNTRSMVDISIFSPLMSLGYLDLSGNNLKISSTLRFPPPLEILILSSCNIAEFPKFLQTKTSLYYLDISANHIEGQVPKWLWRLPELQYVN